MVHVLQALGHALDHFHPWNPNILVGHGPSPGVLVTRVVQSLLAHSGHSQKPEVQGKKEILGKGTIMINNVQSRNL